MGPKLSYDYQAADYHRAGLALRGLHTPASTRLLCWLALFGPAAIAGFGGFYLVAAYAFPAPAAILLIILAWWIGAVLAHRISTEATKRRPSALDREGIALTCELREDSVRASYADGETVQNWSGIHQAFESDGDIYFVVGASAMFIPARAFASPESRREAVEWILSHLTPEARARSNLRVLPDRAD